MQMKYALHYSLASIFKSKPCRWNHVNSHIKSTVVNDNSSVTKTCKDSQTIRTAIWFRLDSGLHFGNRLMFDGCQSEGFADLAMFHMMLFLTHWGRVTHICISKLTIIGSDNGLSPDRRQAIIWTNAGILSIGSLGTKLSEISIAIHIFSFKKMHLKMSSGKWRPCCLGLNVLMWWYGKADFVVVTFLLLSFNKSQVASDLRYRNTHVTSL